jgi:quercetin dioxygenase-like cupin family protein
VGQFSVGQFGVGQFGGLIRRIVELEAGSRLDGEAGAGGELWFVISGTGQLHAGPTATNTAADPADADLRPDRGLWLPPGSRYTVQAGPGATLRLDLVALPGDVAAGTAGPAALLVRDLSDCPVETTGDRKFRVLFGPGRDCSAATQFVGEIPPGRAPDHSHPYDETVLVLRGQGVVHTGGAARPLSPGATTHLPPGQPHCLENTGSELLRVLGVFHPADTPAAKLPASPDHD